ncbi:hypothetical protein ACE2AJ_07350 [Aquihabitans daechungensis]|uniref:hypothetical protein n=1 Tax=Aquihabitans daechungensis TaxID=1052257 RepID=UPI003B9F8935
MDTSRVTLGDKVTAGAGILLLITLLFLPWHQVFSFSQTAVEAPGGWWGTLAALLTLLILVGTFLRRVAAIDVAWLPRPIGEVNLAANVLVLALLVLKLALDTDYLGFGAYLALLLAAAMVTGAALGRDETDEAPPVGSGGGAPPTPF